MESFVWRKSIYKNKFKCQKCGAKLFDEMKNEPTDNLCVNSDEKANDRRCACGKCWSNGVYNVVAQIVNIPDGEIGKEYESAKGGLWNDFRSDLLQREKDTNEKLKVISQIEREVMNLQADNNRLNMQLKSVREQRDKDRMKFNKEIEKLNKRILELDHENEDLSKKLRGLS